MGILLAKSQETLIPMSNIWRSVVTVSAKQFYSVLLVGFMASGKSTVGRELASLLGWKFSDMDCAIEERCGVSIGHFVQFKG